MGNLAALQGHGTSVLGSIVDAAIVPQRAIVGGEFFPGAARVVCGAQSLR
jgi:hypothetical protein